MEIKKKSIPNYSLGEELFNSISHGIGAALSIAALVLMTVKANGALKITCVTIFGSTMILLYLISCIYHALSKNIKGKKVFRVLDHDSVYLLVFGTYIPVALIGVGNVLGWILFSIVALSTTLGIIFTSINIEKYQILSVILHLINGWSILIGIQNLIETMTITGIIYLALGGIMYSIGAILYRIGAHIKYIHSIFHIFCLLGTFFHFISIYFHLI